MSRRGPCSKVRFNLSSPMYTPVCLDLGTQRAAGAIAGSQPTAFFTDPSRRAYCSSRRSSSRTRSPYRSGEAAAARRR
jgi:hypothetical protein